ncbi:MAG: serine/threonine protein kinase [Kofleriaceae bacterium]
MTTRDPRSSVHSSQGVVRDPTQSLSIDPADEVGPDSGIQHPSLALGTHEAKAKQRDDEGTKVESPAARVRTPAPPRPDTKPPPPPKRTVDDPDNRIGTMLGNYRVVELLGKGGMGYVYRAEHVKLGREVALKLLRTDYAKRKDAVARFIQEARTVNRIRHRNIVDVPDILELDDGTTCIVMELLRGQSLGKWARTGIDLPRALAVLVQICDGLGAAHSVQIVHRDLKPDNVIVVPTSDGAELVKLLDFGVAKLLNRDDEDVGFQTAAGSVIGTPAYMSPEQAGGMPIDGRSDIYSLGAIMYELFCGQPMFRGRSFGEYVRKHLTELPVRPKNTAGGAGLDERLEAIILRALEKDPNHRFQQIIELRDSLLAVLGGLETLPPPPFATMTASGIRPAPLPPPPMQHLPTLPPVAHVPTPSGVHAMPHMTHAPMQQSQIYGAPYYSQIVGLPLAPAQPHTPWWVWFIGGAIAVGLGVGGAVWFAGRSDEAAPAPAATLPPVPMPIQEPTLVPEEAPTAKPALVELRFDSLPSGAVYADGQSAELCTTPCTINIDLSNGAPEQRTYVVKASGHKDGVITVDLASSQREYNVRLEQLAGSLVVGEPVKTKPKATKVTKQLGKAAKKPDKADKKPEVPDTETDTSGSENKPEKKPEKKPSDKIDRSDTLDPFSRKRP